MTEVSLEQMLSARDERAETQRQLLSRFRLPLVCFTMNIAGPIKQSPLIERAFLDGLNALENVLPADAIRSKQTENKITGCQAFLVINLPAHDLKDLCVGIETATPLGRLFDMDVLDVDGNKLERKEQRGCIVCGSPGRACAAGRRHSVTELQDCTHRIMSDHFATVDRESIAALAVDSLIREVQTTPKPGLVDRRNTGSHSDMTLQTFLDSATALRPYFSECFDIGRTTANQPYETTFALLRESGKRAEQTMLSATNGVNTHKGAIFTVGALCGSIGRLWTPETLTYDVPAVLKTCADLVKESVRHDFDQTTDITAGIRAYRNEGIMGIRGEISAGLPSVLQIGLPAYKDALQHGFDQNHAGAVALLQLIARVQDTTLYHRGGIAGLHYAQNSAQALLMQSPYPTIKQLEALDDIFISRRLSPGGSADLLAAVYFLYELEKRE